MTRRIAVIGAGGTIAMAGAHAFDWVDYGDTGIINAVDDVIAGLDLGLADVAIVPHAFRALPSTGITTADWVALAGEVAALAAAGAGDGIVVTHGTATMEETAFFLHAVLEPGVAVVLTGAQRPPNTAGTDAVAGLRGAVAAAAQAPAGVYVAMNGQLFDAVSVTKTANFALDAFVAPETGPVGRIEPDGSLSLLGLPAPRAQRFAIPPSAEALPRVDLVLSHAGADGTAIDALVAAGARGIVSAGLPPGRTTPGERAALLRAVAAGVSVVQSSRALRGQVPLQPYNQAAGILSGGGLAPHKARILVMLALAAGLDRDRLQTLLLDWGKHAPAGAVVPVAPA